MSTDLAPLLWLLKLGALANLYFFTGAWPRSANPADPHIVVPALILFAVSGYRCLFPNRYKDNIVLHPTVLSSTLVTRFLATFAEVAWIYQFSHLVRLLNVAGVGWVDALSWLMVIQVIASQACVWGAILLERPRLYVWEEVGWAAIFLANTVTSAFLYLTADPTGSAVTLLLSNLAFGAVYLPWQLFHLRGLAADARAHPATPADVTWTRLASSLERSLRARNVATDAASWGGVIGITWMTAYWAAVIPVWVYLVVRLAPTP